MTLLLLGQLLCITGGSVCFSGIVRCCKQMRLTEAALLVLGLFFFMLVLIAQSYVFGGQTV